MPKNKLFLDSSALIAGVLSPTGAARALLLMSEMGDVDLYISEHVIAETERSLARKVPEALPEYRKTIKNADMKIVSNLSPDEVRACLYMIADPEDAPILAAAMKTRADYLVTHNRKHFLDDPNVAGRSGLRIGTPGDALAWLREQV